MNEQSLRKEMDCHNRFHIKNMVTRKHYEKLSLQSLVNFGGS
jgi:hypothetical protein